MIRILDFYCVEQKPASKNQRSNQIDQPTHMNEIGRQGNNYQKNGVKQNLQPGIFHTVGDWQHGDIYLGIIITPVDCQGPEVRRRPNEYNQKQ